MSKPVLSTDQFGLKVRPDYVPEQLGRYRPAGYESVDPTSLTATQERLKAGPSLRKITPPGVRNPPQVYEDPQSGERFIGDGHHRIAAHAAVGKSVRVQVWKRTETA